MSLGLGDIADNVMVTLTDPRRGFARILDLQMPKEARLLSLAAVTVLSVILAEVVYFGVPDEVLGDALSAVRHPVTGIILQAASLVILAFGISGIGQRFGGHARFSDALVVVIWIEFVTICIQVVVILMALVLPLAAPLLGILNLALFVWLLTHATTLVNGFHSPVRVFLGMIGTILLLSVVVVAILSAMGVMPAMPGG